MVPEILEGQFEQKAAYAFGFAVTALAAGPWQAAGDFAAEALIFSCGCSLPG